MTSVGPIRRRRRRLRCGLCRDSHYGIDSWLGGVCFLSKRLRRLACLLTSDRAFEPSAVCLHATLGVLVSAETLRLICESEGRQMACWQAASVTVGASFAQAVGELEFQMDAGKANTLTGWRDYKLGIFAKRPLGAAATVAEWDTRQLPAPTARRMFAALEPIEEFQKRLRPEAVRLGIKEPSAIAALGDGAEWIWNAVGSCFPGGSQVAEELAWGDTPERRASLKNLMGYFAKHTHRLNYRERLHEDRSIGSVLVEGSIKTVGLRIKARGARWRVENVDKMAGLCCLRHSSNWDAYWHGMT